ncbi:hypothetical protein [Pinirhizobacter sp.]|uniref:hypothetical protein n=1 Tax=Pinirhizobacter sp. TaxID=2950432 RepID=UPI002F41ADAC
MAVTNPCDPFVCCEPGEPGTNPIDRIELSWDVDGDVGSASWSCDDGNGVTLFNVPPGQALLSVVPVCQEGHAADPSTFVAPAPELRAVNVGDTVSLGAVELLLRIASCGSAGSDGSAQACICGD